MIDTPTRLYLLPLSASTVTVPGGTLDMVLGCYLIQTSEGRRILVDTGTPADYTSPANAQPHDQSSVIEQLAQLGLSPEDIDTVICTHLDIDHAGYNDAFAQAELIVQRRQYDVARGGHPRFADGRSHWDHPSLNYRLIDGDMDLLPGLSLIETSGHAPGHQSVLVRLPQTGSVLLVIDAAMFARLFTPDRSAGPGDDNPDELRASVQKLVDLVDREHVALVIFGHDGAQWRTLKKAPEYYE
jgi:N-acyl homoserine lactone hydrolase